MKPTPQQLFTSAAAAAASKKFELHPRKSKHRKRAPRGMHLQQPDVLVLATAPENQGELLLKNLEAELVTFKQRVQQNKQLLSMRNRDSQGGIDTTRPPHVRKLFLTSQLVCNNNNNDC